MSRAVFGSLAWLSLSAGSAWARGDAPRAEPQGGSAALWLVILLPLAAMLYILVQLSRSRKTYGGSINRSLQIAEESLELSRRQVALLAENNRLLERLASGSRPVDPS